MILMFILRVQDLMQVLRLLSYLGHFLGNGSVIEILKMQGHNVTHIQADDPLPR